jgi:hypothetical protein
MLTGRYQGQPVRGGAGHEPPLLRIDLLFMPWTQKSFIAQPARVDCTSRGDRRKCASIDTGNMKHDERNVDY